MMQSIALISTYIVFGGVGYLLSRRFKKPLTVNTWIVLAIAAILSQWIMPGARVLDVFGFKMFVNNSLQALLAGMLAGVSIRALKAS